MAGEPLADLRMFMGGVIVDDRLDRLSRWSPLLDGVEEANELLMAMALHVAADDCAVEHIECGEQRCRAVSLVSRGSWFRRDLSSAAGRAGCGQAPGFGSFRRETEQWRELADRHRARPRRAICQRSVGRSKA